MLISFSGLDGAGKSTLIGLLKETLEQRGRRVVVVHMIHQVGFYAFLRTFRDRLFGKPPAPTAASSEHPPAAAGGYRRVRTAVVRNRTVQQLVYLADLAVFVAVRLYHEGLRRRVLIMDRYFYDMLVEVADGRDWEWIRRLMRITPVPDVPVFITIPPSEAFARKGERTLERLERRWASYQRVFGWVPRTVWLANEDLEQAKATLHQVVLALVTPGGDAQPAPAHRVTESAVAGVERARTGNRTR